MLNEPNIDPIALHSLQMPTLVVAGTRDMIKENHTKLIARNIPNAKLSIIKGDHFIAQKKPQEFNREVEAFLQMENEIGS